MPLRKSAAALRQLCLENITHNLPTLWSAQYKESNFVEAKFMFLIGPFSNLDAASVKDILRLVIERGSLSRINLPLLIVPYLKEIDLSGQVRHVSNEVIDMICVRCSNITKFNIGLCSRVSPTYILKFIQKFNSSLKVLGLKKTKITNEVLEEIGSKCKLAMLDITGCEKITRRGLEKMFYVGGEESSLLTPCGASLQAIEMMGVNIVEEVDFLSKLLKNCGNLRRLTHFALWESVLKYCQINSDPTPLNLTGARNDVSLTLSDHNRDLLQTLITTNCVPQTRALTIDNVESMGLELFLIMINCRVALRVFETDWALPYEFLLHVGTLCPNLDTLTLCMTKTMDDFSSVCDLSRSIFNFISDNGLSLKQNSAWKRLEHLGIFWSRLNDFNEIMSCLEILEKIFKSATNLRYVEFSGMQNRNVDDFFMLTLQKGNLRNLVEFHMTCSPHFTIAPVWEMLTNLPKIQVIDVSNCKQITLADVLKVERFVSDNNYDLRIIYDQDHDFEI